MRLLLAVAPETAHAVDKGGLTALHFAARDGHVDVMRLLLAAAPGSAAAVNTERPAPLFMKPLWEAIPQLWLFF